MDSKIEQFISLVFKMFDFLESKGFHVDRSSIEVTQLYCTVPFLGKEVGISFSYDVRENYCECYIVKLDNGSLIEKNDLNGYRGTLYSFLVKKRGYRGKIPIPDEMRSSEFKELYGYRSLLIEEGREILEDKARLFDC